MFIDRLLKFYDSIIKGELSPKLSEPVSQKITLKRLSSLIYNELNSFKTKRLLFDSIQASIFSEIAKDTPKYKSKMELPFNDFYLEFTNPILLPFQQPGYTDHLRSLIFKRIGINERNETECFISFFLTSFNDDDDDEGEIMNWGWAFIFETGERLNVGRNEEWWLDYIESGTNLFYWILLYMMCKSVKIETEKLTRQQRRYMERHSIIPKPWHKVILEPKFLETNRKKNEESFYKQRFRYDVIGHFRFNNHHTKNGLKEIVEWIPPHQRGLDNELYIPKIYVVKRGKEIAPQMKDYLNQKKEV